MRVRVSVVGCDDRTDVEMEVDDVEFHVLLRLRGAVNAVGGGCQPTMEVEPLPSDSLREARVASIEPGEAAGCSALRDTGK